DHPFRRAALRRILSRAQSRAEARRDGQKIYSAAKRVRARVLDGDGPRGHASGLAALARRPRLHDHLPGANEVQRAENGKMTKVSADIPNELNRQIERIVRDGWFPDQETV